MRWDDKKTGGRWFESSIGERYSDGIYEVLTHDGDRANFSGVEISCLGVQSQLGDTVIAYWDNRHYAFKGRHMATHLHGMIYVEFDDGGKAFMDAWRVHKLESL